MRPAFSGPVTYVDYVDIAIPLQQKLIRPHHHNRVCITCGDVKNILMALDLTVNLVMQCNWCYKWILILLLYGTNRQQIQW